VVSDLSVILLWIVAMATLFLPLNTFFLCHNSSKLTLTPARPFLNLHLVFLSFSVKKWLQILILLTGLSMQISPILLVRSIR